MIFLGFFVYEIGSGKMVPPPVVTAEVSDDAPAAIPAVKHTGDMPILPVEMNVPFRHLSDDGYVAQFHNTSDKPLRVVITMDGSRAARTDAFDMAAGGTLELGWDRGWQLRAGDHVTAISDGYQGMSWTMPEQ